MARLAAFRPQGARAQRCEAEVVQVDGEAIATNKSLRGGGARRFRRWRAEVKGSKEKSKKRKRRKEKEKKSKAGSDADSDSNAGGIDAESQYFLTLGQTPKEGTPAPGAVGSNDDDAASDVDFGAFGDEKAGQDDGDFDDEGDEDYAYYGQWRRSRSPRRKAKGSKNGKTAAKRAEKEALARVPC